MCKRKAKLEKLSPLPFEDSSQSACEHYANWHNLRKGLV